MTPEQAQSLADIEVLVRRMYKSYDDFGTQGDNWSGNLPGRVDVVYQDRNKPTADEIAAAVVAALPPSSGGGGGVDLATVVTAVRTVFAEVTGELKYTVADS